MIDLQQVFRQIQDMPPSDKEAVATLVKALYWSSSIRDLAHRKVDEVREVYIQAISGPANGGEDGAE